ncbi:MAG: hypothetical protein ABFC34_07775 [Methanobacterium sp.]
MAREEGYHIYDFIHALDRLDKIRRDGGIDSKDYIPLKDKLIKAIDRELDETIK